MLDDGKLNEDATDLAKRSAADGSNRLQDGQSFMMSLLQECVEASKTAKRDPERVRQATFTLAEASLVENATCTGPLRVNEDIEYIFKRMGINSKEDTRFWIIRDADGAIHEVRLAVNANPADMNNHLIMTTTLQYELDRLRAAGELSSTDDGKVDVRILYRCEPVVMRYKKDGRFRLVVENPITRKQVEMNPLERMHVAIQKDGVPLLIAEPSRDIAHNYEEAR